MGTLLTWLKVTSVISLTGISISYWSSAWTFKLTLVTCPLLAGLWTFIKLEKNMVFYQKPQQACLLLTCPCIISCICSHIDTLLFEHSFLSYLLLHSLTMGADDSARSPHGCGCRSAVLQHSSRGERGHTRC